MNKLLKLFITLILIALIITMWNNFDINSVFVVHHVNSSKTQQFNSTSRVDKDTKTVLFWTPMFSRQDFYFGFGDKIFKDCWYDNCYLTADKNYLPVENFSAILFHGVQYTESAFGKPKKRNPDQIYIFVNLESPKNTPSFIKNQKNFYNWTMTYRMDSDIVRTYGSFVKKETDYEPPSADEIQTKTKKIAWFVSHCNTSSKREKVYNQIKKLIDVDMYGNCGSLKCDRSKTKECYDMLELKYKFYLSFENSLCEDYVTEKLYEILKRDVVPIVYGGADYDNLAPPKSVINVLDFGSVKDLVMYIKFLDENEKEYLKFFKWKEEYVVEGPLLKDVACTLCQKLNEPIEPKVYEDIHKWWFGAKMEMCVDDAVKIVV